MTEGSTRFVNPEFIRRFGLRVKLLRVERNLSQEQLAHAAGLHRTFVGLLERGQVGMSVDRLPNLARALAVEEHELIPRRAPARVGEDLLP